MRVIHPTGALEAQKEIALVVGSRGKDRHLRPATPPTVIDRPLAHAHLVVNLPGGQTRRGGSGRVPSE